MIGVDFGGTNIKFADVEAGHIARSLSVTTHPKSGPEAVLDAVAGGVLQLDQKPKSFGLAIPGEVDATGRCWRLPNVPGFEGVAIAAELERRTGAKVVVENDGTTAALGESLFGHGTAHTSFLMMTLGTGIGGGLVVDRKVVRGQNGFAAEIGHILVDSSPDAWPCPCGNRGCVEAYAGTRGLLRRFSEFGGSASSIRELGDAGRSGDAAALRTFEHMGEALALALTSIQNVLDLGAVVFTGGVSNSFDLIEPSLRAVLTKRAFAKPLGEVPLLLSELADRAGVVGAAYLPKARPTE